MIDIDGRVGEGGGQVLRTALSLAAITGKSFALRHIRGKRSQPGLKQQHLTGVQAAAAVCQATVHGAKKGSDHLEFLPGPRVLAGHYRWDIATAGSTTLVLQTVLPILAGISAASTVEIVGGTHNPFAPPADFLQQSFLPQIAAMGFPASVEIKRYGFHPRGGGLIKAAIFGRQPGAPIDLSSRQIGRAHV